MLKLYLYKIKLVDPLFYAREGLSGAFTPPYLHGTAVNLAVKSALNFDPEDQPLLVSDHNGGRNIPRYSNSLVSDNFYFTPARLVTPLNYFPAITKGENDGYIFKTGMGELFQAGMLNYISPEAVFEGYLIEKKAYSWPYLIRLGSFRGKASFTLFELEMMRSLHELTTVNHPIDPLVTSVKRGITINMFPYPLVENAQTYHTMLTKRNDGSKHVIAFPDKWDLPYLEKIRGGKKATIV
ncbi:MAG: hypothetical protein U9R01_03075 [candidate division WOR-3 bacterium]|nr:hypothetical protein [candidate division WOR-3 bacterium]